MKKIAILNHNDLDALGCVLNINNKFPNVKKKYFYTNYIDLEEKVNDVIKYCHFNKPDLLLITDISFSNNKKELKKLSELKKYCPIIFIDHHVYSKDFFDDIDILKYHDINKSSTKIIENIFNINNKNLKKLTTLIDIYDTWKMKSPLFKISMGLDAYFRNNTKDKTIDQFANILEKNNYILKDFKNFYINHLKNTKEKIEDYKSRKLITKITPKFTVAFTDDSFNEILYDEFMNGTEFVLIVNSYGILRYRFNAFGNLSDKQKKEIKLKLIGNLNIGHLNAFSDKLKESNFDKIMKKVEDVYKIVIPYLIK